MTRKTFAWSLLMLLACAAACRSPHVQVTVENRTGAEVRLLEVDYPSASFGADSLAAGATMHYKVQLQDKAALKVQYTGPDLQQHQIKGPEVEEGQSGSLDIVLLPGGKAEFHPRLDGGK